MPPAPARRLVLALPLAAALSACDRTSISDPALPPPQTIDAQLRQSLSGWGAVPILPVAAQNPALVDLGRSLFFDKILSGNRDVSCATCHDPLTSSGDARSLAIGTGFVGSGAERTLGPGREFTPRNAPSLFNAGLSPFYLFWDGRVSLEGGVGRFRTPAGSALPTGLNNLLAAQAMFPVVTRGEMRGLEGDVDAQGNPNELAAFRDDEFTAIWGATMKRVLGVAEYMRKFNTAYPGVPASQLGFQHAANAIAAFQVEAFARTNSPFDRYLARDDGALSLEQKQGALLFFGKARCSSCHSGPLLGGQSFANVGVPQLGPGSGARRPLDPGRDDFFAPPGTTPPLLFFFRVPPLRNVELSAPYMHNGAYATLEAVVKHYTDVEKALRTYDTSQLEPALRDTYHGDATTIQALLATLDGRLRSMPTITDEEQKQLVAFLKSLTDPSARQLAAQVPATVPSGLAVR